MIMKASKAKSSANPLNVGEPLLNKSSLFHRRFQLSGPTGPALPFCSPRQQQPVVGGVVTTGGACYTQLQGKSIHAVAIRTVQIQAKNSENAVGFFYSLLQMGLEPDNATLLNLVSADLVISNALIGVHSRCGDILVARKLFDGLVKKDAVSWNVMINGYGLYGNGEAAVDLLLHMKLSGIRPNGIIFSSVLSAFSHSGLVEQGRMVFKSMAEHGIVPQMEHYACMVDLLGRTGNLTEAYGIVRGLPCKPGLLESLLGACRIHGNVELGEKIGGLLSELDPENSRPHIMLHNIYAAAGSLLVGP
ncbi:hypothetical protein M0R45_004651 [Rubus argutus]|uniref:Pentatricopeptide repeat-containing protein n=1 Tax=Rubus argutus TaxID=59490 RepID=A0AAW1YKH7_RUBAR